jgi:hypothetical protein
MSRIGGTIFVKRNGTQFRAKGSWTYNLGRMKKTAVVGSDGVHGFKVEPQVPFIEGSITDQGTMSATDLLDTEGATITLELANGKIIQLSDASFCGEGNITTEEGEIAARFEGLECEEIRKG